MDRAFVVRVPRKLVFALVPALLLVGVAEVGQRLSDWRKERRRAGRSVDRYAIRGETPSGVRLTEKPGSLVVELHPHLTYRCRPNQRGDGVRVNAQGFRGADWPERKQPGTTRVFVLGGSMVFGQGVSADGAVLDRVLEDRLQRAAAPGARFEVLNAGVIGYTATQELVLFATDLVHLEADVVVVVDGWNDFYAGGHLAPEREPAPYLFAELDEVIARSQQLGPRLLRLSALYRGLERKVARARAQAVGARGAYGAFYDNPKALALYRRSLGTLCRLARAGGARVVVAAQPEAFARKEPIPAAEQALREKIRATRGDFTEPGYADFALARYGEYVRTASEVAAAEGARFFDATSAYDGLPDAVFVDFVHVDDRGHEVLAERLAPLVAAAAADAPAGR